MNGVKHLLFVDDEEEILYILQDLFSSDEYKLHIATRGEDALQILENNYIDLIFSDLKLPDINGWELLNCAKDKNPETVRILTSGYLELNYGTILEDEKDGTLYVSKPWDIHGLKSLVVNRLS